MYFPFVNAACLLFVLTLSHTPVLLGNGEVRRLLRAEVQLKNAKVYLRTGQPEKGLMLLNRSLAANPDSPESWYTRGLANFKLERHEEACQDWKKACQMEVNWCLGEEYSKAGKFCLSNETGSLE